MKLICQYAFWPVLGLMMISRTKNWSKIQILPPPETEIINLVSEYYAETSSMTIYVHMWLILICEHAFCPVLGFIMISRAQNVVKNMQIMPILAPWIPIFQSGASILFKTSSMTIYGHIWLKLIFQHVFWPVIGFLIISRTKNWSKICQKYRFCPPLNPEYPI